MCVCVRGQRERERERERRGEKMGDEETKKYGSTSGDKLQMMDGSSVWVWGEGNFGLLGLGAERCDDPVFRPTPLAPAEGSDAPERASALAVGGMHTVIVSANATATPFSWGVNDEKALGRDADAENSALPGRVSVPAASGSKLVAASCGNSHSLFLSEDGRVFGCGTFRDDGPLGFSPGVRIQDGAVEIAIPGLSTTKVGGGARKRKRGAGEKSVIHTTTTAFATTKTAGDDSREYIIKVASGGDHAVMLSNRGNAFTVGYGGHGQLGRCGSRFSSPARELEAYVVPVRVNIPKSAGKVVDVFCGDKNTIFVTEKRKVYGCGLNNYGQLGVKGDGNGILRKPTLIPGLTGRTLKSVACGAEHTLAVVVDDDTGASSVVSFGRAAYGRLGRNIGEEQSSGGDASVPVPGVVNFEDEDAGEPIAVAAGTAVSAAIMNSGLLFTWGCGESFLHAKGDDDDDEPMPRRVKRTKRWNGHKVVDVAFGGQHAVILCQPMEGSAL